MSEMQLMPYKNHIRLHQLIPSDDYVHPTKAGSTSSSVGLISSDPIAQNIAWGLAVLASLATIYMAVR